MPIAIIVMSLLVTAVSAGAQGAPVNADAKVMAEFTTRVEAYAALQRKIRDAIPKLPDEATPRQIDTHQRALGTRMARERAGARQGDVFTPETQDVIRRMMATLFTQTESKANLRASINDENPKAIRFQVNGRYPDDVPLSTMPPAVLQNLPKLPEALEYRFVGESLILLDPLAHIVVDFVPRAIPK
jgi:hypothetical protein